MTRKHYIIPATDSIRLIPEAKLLSPSDEVGYTGGGIGGPVGPATGAPGRLGL